MSSAVSSRSVHIFDHRLLGVINFVLRLMQKVLSTNNETPDHLGI